MNNRLEYPYAVQDLTADSTDVFKFSFKIDNKEKPHQAMVVFQSQDEFQDEIMVAASVKSSGKGRFDLVRNNPLSTHTMDDFNSWTKDHFPD